ncbi:class I SAM-dependent methyltransferase [Acholeplasma granularum]|uniref:class I SAM-dependent methyltransferase n=1 Tax=Acholeplasma granularum TaxID=264635 RepID=UPI0004AF1853|nr:methyltransferase [Acholeplasma granularum]
MSHYFKNDLNLKSEEFTYDVNILDNPFTFISDRGVFSANHLDTGSEILIKSIEVENKKTLLDIGSGIGVIGVILKKVYPFLDVTQIDINKRALSLNEKNNELNNVTTKVIESDLFENVQETFDVIVSNPPIRTGKKVIYKLYADSYKHLNSNGTLWIVVRKDQGAKSTIDYLKTMYQNVEIMKRHKGFYVIKGQKC